jgi:uncharacterized protein DUF6843
MISGSLLFALLIVLATWFLLLCIAFRQAKRTGSTNRITLAGLGSASVAVASLLGLHATWISADVSQRLGVTAISVLGKLLFWSTVLGLVGCVFGKGKLKFVGLGSVVITGLWWAFLAASAGISMGAPLVRHPIHLLIPNGYLGWVEVRYGDPTAPALPIMDGVYLCRIPANGVLTTSSKPEEGWAADEYDYYGEDGSTKRLKQTNWGGGGMVWSGAMSWKQGSSRPTQTWFIGTEGQFKHGLPADERH